MQFTFLVLRRIEATVLATSILVMACATIANVVARNWLGENLAAAEELNQFLIVLVCFVGLSYAAGCGRHIRMTAISNELSTRVRRWLMIVISITTAALLLALAGYALSYALSVDRRSPVLDVPLGGVYMIAPIGLFLGAVQYALAAYRNLTSREVYVSFDRLDRFEELDEPPQGS